MEFLTPWLPVLILLALTTLLAGTVIGLSAMLGPQRPTRRKLMPYESGMTPFGSAMRRMPIPFYLVAIEFLLFDVEIMFLLPYALVMRELGLPGLAAVGIFVSFIIVGFVYALKIGTLNWSHTSPGRDAMEQHTPLRPPIGIQRVAGEAMS